MRDRAEGCPLSILVPAFNAEETVGEAVESALAQGVPGAEVVVCDDGSGDGTGEVLKGFRGRIRLLSNPVNRGVGRARQRLVSAAGGEYALFLDADDALPDGYAAAMLAAADGADVVFSAYEKGGKLYGVPKGPLTTGQVLSGLADPSSSLCSRRLWGRLWKRSLLRSVPIPPLRMAEDELAFHRLILKAETFRGCPEAVYSYRPGGMSGSVGFRDSLFLVKARARAAAEIAAGCPEAAGPASLGVVWAALSGLRGWLFPRRRA